MPTTAQSTRSPVLLSNGSLRNWGLSRVFELAAGIGYDGMEVIVDERTDTIHADYLKRLIDRHRLPVPVLHGPFSFLEPPGWEREELPRLIRTVRLAEEIGSDGVVLHTPFYTNRSFLRWMEEDLADFQRTTSVTILVENMPCYRKVGGRLGRKLAIPDLQERRRRRGFWKLVPDFFIPPCFPLSDLDRMAQFPHIILDTTHLGTAGIDPIAAFDRFRAQIGHIHLSNFDGREHLEVQSGLLDLAVFLRHTTRSGYRGGYCLEIMPDHFPSADEGYARKLLAENLAFIRSALSS